MTPPRPLLMLITEPHPRLAGIVASAVAGGVDIVQWREKGASAVIPGFRPPDPQTRERVPWGVWFRPPDPHPGGAVHRNADVDWISQSPFATICSTPRGTRLRVWGSGGRKLPFDINGDKNDLYPALRAAVAPPARLVVNAGSIETLPEDADGLHLPEHGGSVAEARRLYGESISIGRSVHEIESALQAEVDGADYVIAGTIFASNSHPGETPAGLNFLRALCASVRIPVIAIGGITPDNAPDCLDAGASGVAVLSAIMRADDPKRAAEAYRQALDRSLKGTGS